MSSSATSTGQPQSGRAAGAAAEGAEPGWPVRASLFIDDSTARTRSILYFAGLLLRTERDDINRQLTANAEELFERIRVLADCVVAIPPDEASPALDAPDGSADPLSATEHGDAGVAPPRRASSTPSSSRLGLVALGTPQPARHSRPGHLEPIARSWAALVEAVHALDARDLFTTALAVYRRALTHLERARPQGAPLVERLAAKARVLLRWLYKNLMTVTSTLAVLHLVINMQPIAAFFANAWLNGLMLLYLFVPTAMVVWRQWSFDRALADADGETPLVRHHDIGGVTFRKLDPLVVAPSHFPELADDSSWPAIYLNSIARKLLRYFGALVPLVVGLFAFGGWITGDPQQALTAFVFATALAVVLGFARLIDFWDYLDPRDVRIWALIAVVVLLVLANLPQGRVPVLGITYGVAIMALLLVSAAINLTILIRARRAVLARVLMIAALVAVASMGSKMLFDPGPWRDGGAAPLDRLTVDEWPYPGEGPVVVVAASGGGSRAAIYAAHAFERLHLDPLTAELGPAVQAVSSVSGGSLATAIYVGARLDEAPIAADTLLERARRDFALPVALGFLSPASSRGASIEAAFRDAGLGDLRLSSVRDAWRAAAEAGAPAPPCPVPLFNTVTLDANAVVLSPLVADAYELVDDGLSIRRDARDEDGSDDDPRTRNDYAASAELDGADEPTWVYYRDAIYGLEDLLAGYDPALYEAVRASANFPFGFPLVEIETERPRIFSPLAEERRPGEPGRVHLTDGGVLSNSGMWPLYHLLHNNRARLTKRGVVLLVVNASRMPTKAPPRAISGLWATIQDQVPLGADLHRRMYDELHALYGGRLAIHHIDLTPTRARNIWTSWMLPRDAQALLDDIFTERWGRIREGLAADFETLKAPAGRVPERPIARLPLD